MDFRELKYVLAIAEAKSFSLAAKKLYISQPSLSEYIRKLEQNLGSSLFDRSKSPIGLTNAGEEYVAAAERILDERKQLLRRLNDISGLQRGRLSIGVTTSRGTFFLPRFVPAFKKKYPSIDIELVEERESRMLEELMIRGKIELMIASLPIKTHGIVFEHLIDERVLLAAPRNHSICKDIDRWVSPHPLSLADLVYLKDDSFILLPPSMKLRSITDKIFHGAGFKANIMFETYNIHTAQNMVGEGCGFTFVPELLIIDFKESPRPMFFPLDCPESTWPLVVAYRERGYLTKAAWAFIETMKELISKPRST